MVDENYVGSSFDSFLVEEDCMAECKAASIKRVLAWQLEQTMEKENLTKSDMAARMKTSRSAVARLLDPKNTSISLQTMERAAMALGKKLEIQLVG